MIIILKIKRKYRAFLDLRPWISEILRVSRKSLGTPENSGHASRERSRKQTAVYLEIIPSLDAKRGLS